MKKISIFLFASVTILFTSCLKDKNFDRGRYGINDPDTQPPGVGFPLSAKANNKNTVGLNVSSTPQTVDGILFLNLLDGEPAPKDIHVTIVLNDGLRTSYNDANNPDLALLPASLYSFATTITIPAGQRNAQIPITVSNTSTLNPTVTYGLGVSITGVDGGYTIANNLKNLLIEFTIKNQYEGKYRATGFLYHPSSPRAVSADKDVLTAGANSVDVFLGDLGTSGYVARLTVDPATNLVTVTAAPGAVGAPYTQFNTGLPTTSPGYTPQWSGSALCNNTYDPVTKTFYVRYGYVGGTGWRVTEEHIKKL